MGFIQTLNTEDHFKAAQIKRFLTVSYDWISQIQYIYPLFHDWVAVAEVKKLVQLNQERMWLLSARCRVHNYFVYVPP